MKRNALICLICVFLLTVGLLSSTTVTSAFSATFIVTKTADTNDGACNADCSLREAIIAANANPGDDSLTLPEGTFTLTIAGSGENAGATGDLDITGNLTINGAGSTNTFVDGNMLDRVFEVRSAAIVIMSGITVQNGTGGIFNNGSTLTLNDIFVRDNLSSSIGGGINNYNGTLTLNESSVISNTVTNDSAGGIANSSESTLTLLNSTVIGNKAYDVGGGIYNSGNITITNSSFSDNTSAHGGGLSNDGAAVLRNMTFSNNEVGFGGRGGGMLNSGNSTLTDITFSNNLAEMGGGMFNEGTANLANVTFTGNRGLGFYGWGGGMEIYNPDSLTILTNVTFSDNYAYMNGGGLTIIDGTVELTNVTITNNDAFIGGGISAYEGSSVILKNIILAGNNAGDRNPDCDGTITSFGHNLIQDTTGCTIIGDQTGNLYGEDPLLGPLTDNGGLTFTHALLLGSPAIDSADNAQCPTSDQRGVFRPQDGNDDGVAFCDMGSYELAGPILPPVSVNILGAIDGFVGYTYPFTATVQPISTTIPLTYTWQADGQLPATHIGELIDSVNFTWDVPGMYAIGVTASNPAGAVMDTHAITITDVPILGLTASNDSPTLLGDATTLIATVASGSNIIYTWDFGNGEVGEGEVVTHTYPEVGSYTAAVTARNGAGEVTATTLVTIQDVPIMGLSAMNNSPTLLGNATTFSATVTSGTNVVYTWDFGDGTGGSGKFITHTYPTVGNFTAIVTATNSITTLSDTTQVTIISPSYQIYLPLMQKE